MQITTTDFEQMSVGRLFRLYFIPTLMGMLSIAAMTAIDGAFAGYVSGSDGIAAINIVVPIQMVMTGFGLMLGVGSSVSASIALANGHVNKARVMVSGSIVFASIATIIIVSAIEFIPNVVGRLLGASENLMPPVYDYMVWLMPGMLFQVWGAIGLFAVRLDGAPKVAMICNVIPALTNIFLDWLLMIPFDMGVKGAAIASTSSMAIGGTIAISYLFFRAKTLRFTLNQRVKETLRNVFYDMKIGVSALMGEATMGVLMFIGNIVFMQYLGDNGVAAFGIACYYMPFVFMVGNAIAQSVQPIISYNYARHSSSRVHSAEKAAAITGIASGIIISLAFLFIPELLVGIFIDASSQTYKIAVGGFPWFSFGFIFFILNLVFIGYFQSVERIQASVFFALLRGVVVLIPAFYIAPLLWGVPGIWLALGLSELITLSTIVLYYIRRKKWHNYL